MSRINIRVKFVDTEKYQVSVNGKVCKEYKSLNLADKYVATLKANIAEAKNIRKAFHAK